MSINKDSRHPWDTWQKRIQSALDESLAFCMGVFTDKGEKRYANKGMRMLLSRGDSQTESTDVFVNPTFAAMVESTKSRGRTFEGVLTVKCQDNAFKSLQARAYRQDGYVLIQGEYDVEQYESMNRKMISMNREINLMQRELIKEKKILETTLDQLRQTQDKLIQSEKMSSLGRMVAGFAHEINTPIGVAVTAASTLDHLKSQIFHMLSQEEVEEADLVENLESIGDASHLILRNLKRTGDLVNSFKRTAIDQSSDEARLFSIKENIDDTIISLQNKLKNKPIQISVDCPSDLNLYGFPGAISQILTNLIINSLTYGFDNAALSGEIQITVAKTDQDIIIEYRDTGRGMEPSTLRHIFEPFYTTGRNIGGAGLGLFICFNLVKEQLGGTIECQSQPGEGVTFQIQFPIKGVSHETHS